MLHEVIANDVLLPVRFDLTSATADDDYTYTPSVKNALSHTFEDARGGMMRLELAGTVISLSGAKSVFSAMLANDYGLLLQVNGHTLHLVSVGSTVGDGETLFEVGFPPNSPSHYLPLARKHPITTTEFADMNLSETIEALGGFAQLVIPHMSLLMPYNGKLTLRAVA